MKTIFYAILFISLSSTAFAQTDTILWTSASLPNGDTTAQFHGVSGSAYNVFDTITNSGDVNGPTGWNNSLSQYPQVSHDPVNVDSTVQLYTNWQSGDSSLIMVKFRDTVTTNLEVDSLTFRINDIDKASTTNPSYIDSVSVMGYAGGVPVYPDTPFTLYDPSAGYTIVSGNSAFGNPINGLGGNCPNAIATDPTPTPFDASVTVHFSHNIDSLVIRYGDTALNDGVPNGVTQVISLDTMYFVTGAVLPVKLTDFTGQLQDQSVVLNWNTASELNNDHFDVQRSEDGVNFTTVGSVPGHGTTSIPQAYAYTDDISKLASPSVYYRLDQINYDGTGTFSKVIEIKLNSGDINVQNIYPNPFVDRVQLQLNFNTGGIATVRLYDANGTSVYSSQSPVGSGSNLVNLSNLGNLPSGLYIIEVTMGNSVYRGKLLKQ